MKNIRPWREKLESWISSEINTDRIIKFSDAIIGFSITLLVIAIDVPELMDSENIKQSLQDLWPKLLVFAISFFVVARFWISHLRLVNYVKRFNYPLLWLNLIFLLFIVFIPFSTALYGTHSDNLVATIIYMASLALASFLCSLMWRYISRHRDLTYKEKYEDEIISNSYRQMWAVTISFIACIIFSLLFTNEIHYVWIFYVIINIIIGRSIDKFSPYAGFSSKN